MSSLSNINTLRDLSTARLLAEQLLEFAVHELEALKAQADLIIDHFHELQTYANQLGTEELQIPLYEFKQYLNTTSIPFQDDEGSLYDLLLRQAIPILTFHTETFSIPSREMSRGLSYTLKQNFLCHYHDGAQPGNLLHKRLREMCQPIKLFS